MVMRAIDTSVSHSISFYDAMIVEAAISGGCTRVLTEDLSDRQIIRGLEIQNPFKNC
jgi:predicted nucleic acid-binding protein